MQDKAHAIAERSTCSAKSSACGDLKRLRAQEESGDQEGKRVRAQDCSRDAASANAKIGSEHDMEVLQRLRAQDAAKSGDLDVLKQFAQEPCPWDGFTCNAAAGGGHLHVLEWLRAQDPPCPWTEATCMWAAKSGNLEVLQWLRAQDPPCPWGACTAAVSNDLAVLQWMRAQDPPAPWSSDAVKYALESDNFEMLLWLRSQQPPCPLPKMQYAGEDGLF
jgi:hypothetical protein